MDLQSTWSRRNLEAETMSRRDDAVAAVDVIAAQEFGIMYLSQQPDDFIHEVTAKKLRDALVRAYTV